MQLIYAIGSGKNWPRDRVAAKLLTSAIPQLFARDPGG